ncbi:MAG TPA: hypothetical protein VLS51_02445, partial [Propionibacteriaceae bacterium]|nr:hypothetical protein [Propionibacteriaceae bacterium]
MRLPETPAENDLYEAAALWWNRPRDLPHLVDAACVALVEGLDGEALAELAGMSSVESVVTTRDVVARVFDELGLVWPPSEDSLPEFRYGLQRGPVSTLSLSVERADTEWFVAEPIVQITIDDENWTARAGRSGMHPDDLFRPVNLLEAGAPRVVPISRSNECGLLGCGGVSIRVARDGDRVVWEWLDNGAFTHRHSFAADAYDAEVARAAADRSWD